MNMAFLTGGEGAFINNIKNCGGFTSTAGYAFPTILNADGYPTSTPSFAIFCTVTNMPQADNPEWTVGWSGTLQVTLAGPSGSVTVSGSTSCVVAQSSGSITLGGTDCTTRFTFASAPASLTVTFPASGSYNNPSNLYMVRSDEKTLFDSGEIFRPVSAGTLLAKLADMRVNTLRFLDWNDLANRNIVTRWDYLLPTSAVAYYMSRWEPTVFPGAAGSGVSASPVTGTNSYVGLATNGSTINYVDGQVYQNIVTNGNTSTTPTLQLCDAVPNCGPAVTIVNPGTGALSTTNGHPDHIDANQLATFVYNAKLNKWLYRGGGMASRVPVPILTALCNKAAVNCWYQIPQLFTSASIASYAAHVRDNLSSSLTAYFEYSNEGFNIAASPLSVALSVGNARSFPSGGGNFRDEWALGHRTAMGVITDTWAPRSLSSLVRVMSWAVYETPGNSLALGANQKFDSSMNYCSGSGCTITTNYSVAGSCSAANATSGRPVDCADAFAYAPYYNGAQISYPDDTYNTAAIGDAVTAADNYASGNPSQMSAALDWVDCDIRGTPTATYPNCGYRGSSGTASISGTTLTLSSAIGSVQIGDTVFGGAANTTITGNASTNPTACTPNCTGTGSGASLNGTYGVSVSQTLGSTSAYIGRLGGTTLAKYAITGGTYLNYNALATTYGKYIINYEGGYQGGTVPSATALTNLGITSSALCATAACLSTEFANLISAYRNDARFAQLVYDQMIQFKSYSNSRMPGWYYLGPTASLSPWSIFGGTSITTTPFKSYDGIKNYARGL